MKIYLTEPGDPTVGIFPATFEVDCPFEQDTANPEDLELFKKDIEGLFRSYDVPVKGMYDYEHQQEGVAFDEAYTHPSAEQKAAQDLANLPELFTPSPAPAYTAEQLRGLVKNVLGEELENALLTVAEMIDLIHERNDG